MRKDNIGPDDDGDGEEGEQLAIHYDGWQGTNVPCHLTRGVL